MPERKELILSLGSNCDQEESMSAAKEKLRSMFGDDITFSECVWTEPIGIESDKFLNCLAFTHTSHKLEYVSKAVKHIERGCGNRKRARTSNIVKMDIDILKYANQILHESDWSRKYITELMKECPF
ncbi:MAG TPA: 2-amino-4-hydroxy-6-hydroxymethyldihydropteridine diphosphokinase [Candidatus Prevotella stercoripullorum]|nr:2-amino-4-hydroxy-6-hydroxymethyldihydropteridine diphosphokinase [Candidatus Prevotella stercoripullorum]